MTARLRAWCRSDGAQSSILPGAPKPPTLYRLAYSVRRERDEPGKPQGGGLPRGSRSGRRGAVAGARRPDARAQAPRNFKIVVPYPPASGPDILSRLMAEQIGKMQGATVVIENRPGGGTMIGTEAAARAAPDGGTVLLVANSFVVNPALKPQSYDVTDELRSGLLSRVDADGARGAGHLALQDARRPHRRGARETRRAVARRGARLLAACRVRGDQALAPTST